MTVDSYLELFTTLFGWTFYNILWDVLVGTGIVFLPFLGILIDNWREPAEGGEFGTVTGLSLRRMELDLFIALLVVVLAGQPAALTPLNAGTLSYTPPPTLINSDTDHGNRYGTAEHLRLSGIHGVARDGEYPGLVVCGAVHDVGIQSCRGRRPAQCAGHADL